MLRQACICDRHIRLFTARIILVYIISLSQKNPHWLAKNSAKARPSIWRALSHCPICCSWVSSKLKKGSPSTYDVIFTKIMNLTLKAPITTKVVCFPRLLKCLRSLYEKQFGPRSDCYYMSSLIWVHPVCFYT